MNLLNIYIILAWYEDAERKPNTTDRITNQVLNAKSVRKKLLKDGLFKLILFANMERVTIDERANIQFATRLKLTGDLVGNLFLPCEMDDIFGFCAENRLTQTHQNRIFLLNQEARKNNKLQIWITGRHG